MTTFLFAMSRDAVIRRPYLLTLIIPSDCDGMIVDDGCNVIDESVELTIIEPVKPSFGIESVSLAFRLNCDRVDRSTSNRDRLEVSLTFRIHSILLGYYIP